MKKRKLNKKKLAIFILIVVLICSTLGFSIYSFAKYIAQVSDKILIIPANFKFDSDYLKNNNPTYNIYNWDDGLSIELYNSIYTNKSEVDVPYAITVTNGNYILTDGTNNITCPNDVCTLLVSEDKHIINVTPINTDSPVIVTVESQTYDYTLSATFNFTSIGINPHYSFADNDKYCELTIFTGNSNVNIIIVNWNSNYIHDNTNQLMKNWSGTTGTLSLSRSAKYKFIFFKNTNNICSNITNTEIKNNIITLP